MKRIIFIAAGIFALVSCSKVETAGVDSDQLLTFNVVNYSLQTRVDAYSQDESFGTFAYWAASNWATSKTGTPFFENEKISYSPSYAQGEWGPAEARYWTKTGTITFASYSPYVSGAEKGFSAVPTFTYEDGFKFSNYTVVDATDVDVMVADLMADQTKNNPSYKVSGNTDGVPTLFHHVMTRVAIAFKAAENPNPNNGCEIIVKGVKIEGANNTGSYTQNNDPVWADQAGNASYEFNAAADTIILKTGGETRTTKTVENRILLPQSLGTAATSDAEAVPGPQNLVVDLTIRTKYGEDWAEENVSYTIPLYSDTIPAWDPNMSIVYTVTINPVDDKSPILFDPAVVPWESKDGSLSL